MTMNLITKSYLSQASRWPQTGRHILAQFEHDSIVIYQAYNTTIGHFAATHGYFGGEFSFQRTSWIKTSFLWMMHRAGWGTKPNQEVILAIWLKRSAFESILDEAVHSSFIPEVYSTEAEWKSAFQKSSVLLQWDPDRDPAGVKVPRRALQLGLRGHTLQHYARDWIIDIKDISEFAQRQFAHADPNTWADLLIPHQAIYSSIRSHIAARLGITPTNVEHTQS
jgi:hypothetical protein